jgi:hypothetical protein
VERAHFWYNPRCDSIKVKTMKMSTAIPAAVLLLGTALLVRSAAADDPPDKPTAEVLFAKQLRDRKPVAPGTTFSPGKLYCWNKLTNSESFYLIAHHWIKNGRRVWRQPIQVRGKQWVTWSHFKVTPGSWTVKVTNGSGLLIQSANFTVE